MALSENPRVIKATFPNETVFTSLVQAFVREAAKTIGFNGSSLSQIDVAVEEAASNVAKHAYDAEENSTFDILCELHSSAIRIVIKEKGIPFDPKAIPSFNPEQDAEEVSTAGMGVFLMRAMMDECSFHNLGPEGKETRLVKFLSKESSADAALSHNPAASSEAAVIKEKIQYQVRFMQDHEAIEVSKCAYKSHGYSFFDDHIYYPERLVEMNRSGEMISVVAVTENEVFMGHACLLFQYPEDRCAEMTFVFVNPEYRSQGAFSRLLELLFSAKSKRPLDGVYSYSVANHPFTQKAVARQGFLDCGILLATSPAGWKFKGIPGDPSQRISVILSFRYLGEPQPLTLFCPPQHRAMIAKLYAHIGAANHKFAESPVMPELSGASDIRTNCNDAEGCAEIYIFRYGSHAVQETRKILRSFCLKQIAVVNLFLNLELPETRFLAEKFEQLGFFFAGILPRARFGDALILQYLNNVDMDYSKITTVTEIAQELLSYISQHDPNYELQDEC